MSVCRGLTQRCQAVLCCGHGQYAYYFVFTLNTAVVRAASSAPFTPPYRLLPPPAFPTVPHCTSPYITVPRCVPLCLLYPTVPHCACQADAFKDENSKRRTLEKQMDALCQQVGCKGCMGFSSVGQAHGACMGCRLQALHGLHGLHGLHAFFKPRILSLHVTAHTHLDPLSKASEGGRYPKHKDARPDTQHGVHTAGQPPPGAG